MRRTDVLQLFGGLNGWQRIGVVLSVGWVSFITAIVIPDYVDAKNSPQHEQFFFSPSTQTFVFDWGGQRYEVDGPKGATSDQAFQILQQHIGQAQKPSLKQIGGNVFDQFDKPSLRRGSSSRARFAAMKLTEFRQRYPQYDDMPADVLAKSLHEKYYSDIPFEQFSRQVFGQAPSARNPIDPDEVAGSQAAVPSGGFIDPDEAQAASHELSDEEVFGKGAQTTPTGFFVNPDKIGRAQRLVLHFNYGKFFAIALTPVVSAWMGAYLMVWAARWIIAGFKRNRG